MYSKSLLNGHPIYLGIELSSGLEGLFNNGSKKYDYVILDPAHLTKIQSMGFSTTSIKDFNSTYYLVEDDVLIEKASLSNSNYSNVVNNNNDHNINISIDESIWSSSNLYYGFTEACRVWNYLSGSDIKLNIISSDGNYEVTPRVDIALGKDNGVLSTSTAMASAYPNGSGNSGNLILVNSDFNQNTQQATWNFIHAIGHALGLKHAVNSSSVMNKINFLTGYPYNSNYAFPTTYDISTISIMYPINQNGIISPFIKATNGVFDLIYISPESGISYNWKVLGINGTNYLYEEVANAFLEDLYLSSYRIECTITGGKYLTTITATKNVIIE